MVSTSSMVSLAMFVGPFILPRALGFYRSIKQSSQRPGATKPAPPKVQTCLNILTACVVISLVLSLSYFGPANIFKDTGSRMQVPSSVLFTRLAHVRGDKLSPLEVTLRERYSNGPAEWPLLYAAYGPEALANCPFCTVKEPSTFMWYALPSIMTSHLAHNFLLGMMTSVLVSGPEGARWRIYATIVGVTLAVVDFASIITYDWKNNTTKLKLEQVNFYFWQARVVRLLAFAVVDALLGWALWLTSTNRWLIEPPSITEQIDATAAYLAGVHGKLQALGSLQNTILRNDILRDAGNEYWQREPRFMEEIEQEREVMDAKRLAISRMDYDKIRAQTNNWVDNMWEGLRPPRPTAEHEKVD